MEFVAATNNNKKLHEMRRILEKAGHTVKSLSEVGVNVEPPETGKTFEDNAIIKATMICKAVGKPTLADDSGLCVDALGGEPGVNSARFSGRHGDDAANNKKLLFLLERFSYAQRTAQFVCALALAMPDGALLTVEGRCEGRIGFAESGGGGFGYDPLFYIGSKSFAEMTDDEKDAVSHRAVALERLLEELPAFLAGDAPDGGEN